MYNYNEVYTIPRYCGRSVRITFCDDAECVMPWSVQHGGAGHYFPSLREALRFAQGRGYVSTYSVLPIEAEIMSKMSSCTGEKLPASSFFPCQGYGEGLVKP